MQCEVVVVSSHSIICNYLVAKFHLFVNDLVLRSKHNFDIQREATNKAKFTFQLCENSQKELM